MPTEPKDLIPAEEIAAFVAHPVAEIFPMIGNDELRELAEDIRKNGMIEPITLFEGKVLDGRNRLAAAKSVGFPFRRINFRELLCGLDPQVYVISANIKRRHLTAEQKRDLIARLLKADPAKSDRLLAGVVKVDNKTVGAVREKLEAREEIPHVETRTDSAGRKQPKNKKKPSKPRSAKQVYHVCQEQLIDALLEFSSADHAEEHAEETKSRLDETIASMRKEEKEAA